MTSFPIIRVLPAAEVADRASELGSLLLDAVDDGASIGFLASVTTAQLNEYWTAAAQPEKGYRVLVAQDSSVIEGVVIVAPILNDIQPHRSEVLKMVVRRRARGRGVARLLMRAAEAEAARMNRPVMTLFTRDGCAAEKLYASLGWHKLGVIPDGSLKPDGTLCSAAVFYKRASPPA
jgi:GNAT superfamily N-acetyltransferase